MNRTKRKPPTSRKRVRPAGKSGRNGETLTKQAYDAIEESIVTLRLQPGDVLSEIALAAQFEIGRTPVREALQRLAGEGLVTILPRRGILVSDINPRRQLLLLEVRREIERLLARSAAIRQSKDEQQEFRRIAAEMELAAERKDDISFMRHDRALNKLIADAARNEYAARVMRSLQGLSRRFWYMHYREAADLPLCARLHARQAAAIALGDPERAAKATDRLIDYVETFTRATVVGSSDVTA